MAEIGGPYEILELAAGQATSFRVVSFELGRMKIHPTWPGAPEEKIVDGVRVHVDPRDKEWLPNYWDLTAGHLVAGLKPLLPMLVETGKRVTLTAGLMRPGDEASKRFKIEVEE
jgi:hypothetical protein